MQKTKTWLRSHKKEVAFGIVVFIVSSLSFGLGYLANREFNHAPIIIETHPKENPR